MKELVHIIFNENVIDPISNEVIHEEVDEFKKLILENKVDDSLFKDWKYNKNHLKELVIEDLSKGLIIGRLVNYFAYLSKTDS